MTVWKCDCCKCEIHLDDRNKDGSKKNLNPNNFFFIVQCDEHKTPKDTLKENNDMEKSVHPIGKKIIKHVDIDSGIETWIVKGNDLQSELKKNSDNDTLKDNMKKKSKVLKIHRKLNRKSDNKSGKSRYELI